MDDVGELGARVSEIRCEARLRPRSRAQRPIDGRRISASISSTLRPTEASAFARFSATVVLPSPEAAEVTTTECRSLSVFKKRRLARSIWKASRSAGGSD